MAQATGDRIAIITADLQDPPELVPIRCIGSSFKPIIGNQTARKPAAAASAKVFHHLMKKNCPVQHPRWYLISCFDRQVAIIIAFAGAE
jgi:dolichol-phosphate mannosyltransferase